jgi:hypothetical protein
MIKSVQLCTALALAALGGCASAPPTDAAAPQEKCYRNGEIRTCSASFAPSREQVADVRRLRPASAGTSRVVVVRNDWFDAHGQAALTLDGAHLSTLIPCSVLGVNLQPGEHTFQVGNLSDAQSRLRINLKSEEVAVLRVRRTPIATGPRGFSLARLQRADALKLVQECPVLGLLDKTAASAM